jgi:hypothetical protein
VKLRTLAAAVAVVVIPIAVRGAETPPSRTADYDARKVCRVDSKTGSRLGGVQRCRSKAEWDQARQESRRVVDRMQGNKSDSCPPVC